MPLIDYWKLPIAYHVFFCLFIVISIVELVFAFLEIEKARKIVKTFCLLFLTISMAFLVPNEPFLYIGLALGAVGDFLLIFKKSQVLFILGTIAFFADHGFLIAEYIKLTGNSGPWYLCFTFFFIPIFTLALMVPGWKLANDKKLGTFGTFYFSVLFLDCIWAIISTITTGKYFGIAIMGGLFFIASDFILTYTRFQKTIKRREFYVMGTYLLAQAFVALGVGFSALI